MAEIIPAILTKDKTELDKKIKMVEPFVQKVHIDVMDGKFVPNLTIQASDLKKTNLLLEAHLMIEEPEKQIEDFAKVADLIIVHAEACANLSKIIKQIKGLGVKVGVALNPPASLSTIEPILDEVDMILLMTVNPGFSGQTFISDVLPKIEELRKKKPNLDIEVDGGIKVGTARKAVKAGANLIAASSAIFEKPGVEEAIRLLRKDVKSIAR